MQAIEKWKYSLGSIVPFGVFELATHSQAGLVIGGTLIGSMLFFGPQKFDLEVLVAQVKHAAGVLPEHTTEVKAESKSKAKEDDGYLRLADEYTPHANSILGRGLLCVGQRGAGKSNAAAMLLEQIGVYKFPAFIIDYKMDYITLPEVIGDCVIAGSSFWKQRADYDGYWVFDKANAYENGRRLMQTGEKVIFQVRSYRNLDEVGEVILGVVRGMLDFAADLPKGKKVPSLILMDEAQQFLPQNQGISHISKEMTNELLSVFEQVNSVGRSLGLTPAYFTQRIAQIKKEVIGGTEIYWLMRQTQPVDLTVYAELIGKENAERDVVQSLNSGDALVFDGGTVDAVHFYERQSEHLSTTPKLEDATEFYRTQNIETDYVSPVTEATLQVVKNNAVPIPLMPETGRKAEDVDMALAITVWNALDPSVSDLQKIFGLTNHQARKLRDAIMEKAKAAQPEYEQAASE